MLTAKFATDRCPDDMAARQDQRRRLMRDLEEFHENAGSDVVESREQSLIRQVCVGL